MKTLPCIIALFFLCSHIAGAQEFDRSDNGLMYSDGTIRKLKFIVDSMNLKFKTCDPARSYRSMFRAKANYIYLDTLHVKAAKKDIDAHISYQAFVEKYVHAASQENLLMLKQRDVDYNDNKQVSFESVVIGHEYSPSISVPGHEVYEQPVKGKWFYEYSKKTTYSKEHIRAFYFTDEFTQEPIPEKYARLVQYADCIVDTNAQIFSQDAQSSWGAKRTTDGKELSAFKKKIGELAGAPADDTNYESYLANVAMWEEHRKQLMDSLMAFDSSFNKGFRTALSYALRHGGSDGDFENWVERYDSPQAALALKRKRIVMGRCSQDGSPRYHAMEIARLSAETTSWDIFVRAHLDIMNDRFQRVSDGSYAWGNRKTYIRELEVLDIHVQDLLLGISIRAEQTSKNHYYGSINRLGRALSETRDPAAIEIKLQEMIADDSLDIYNRILMFYLYHNYTYHLESAGDKKRNIQQLATALKQLPAYVTGDFVIKDMD